MSNANSNPTGVPTPIGDANIERLLTQAYAPETPDAAFVRRITHRLETEATSRRVPQLRTQRSWKQRAALAVAACLIVATGLAALLTWRQNRMRVIVHVPPVPAPRSPAPVPADKQSPREVEKTPVVARAMVPRPALPVIPARRLSIGQSVATNALENQRLALPDGSMVYLNQNTTVSLKADRRLEVSAGEIFVEVAQRMENGSVVPFLVRTPDRELKAIGTKFDVRVPPDRSAAASPAATSVVVTQGKVQVSGIAETLRTGQQLANASASDSPAATTTTTPTTQPAAIVPAPAQASVLDWTRDLVVNAHLPLVTRSVYAGGTLVVKSSNDVQRLSLRKYHVDVHIEDGFARTTIDQTYFNPDSSRVEGTFYFPLPPDASLSRLAMYVDGKLMEGGMAEREYARQTYESIVRTMRDPALLEWVDGTTFKMRVFPLEGRQEKRIVLSYTQRLESLYGKCEYRFPVGHTLGAAGAVSFHARVKGGAGVSGNRVAWQSPSHAVAATSDGGDLLLDTKANAGALDHDFVLRGPDGTPDGPAFATATLDGARYLSLRLRPDIERASETPRRDWVFLFEASAARGSLLSRAQIDVIAALLANAEHDDTFNIITVGVRARALLSAPQPVTADNVRAALQRLADTQLIGGLDLAAAFDAAAPMLRAAKNPWLVHVGSARPTLGERRDDALIKLLPEGTRYVGIGVGREWSRPFMKVAAARTGGYFTQINPDEPIAWRAVEVLSALNGPRLLDVKVREPSGRVAFLCCDENVVDGQSLFSIAKLAATDPMPSSVTVSGTLDGQPWERTFSVSGTSDGAGYLPRTWAKLEIDRLLAENAAGNRARIVELSKAMYVMSPFTSLLVLENEAMYAKFNVDRGRKDHWAMYPCPDTIPVVNEPLPAPPPAVALPAGHLPPARDVLQTILYRERSQVLTVPVRTALERAQDRQTWWRGVRTTTRVYDVRDLIISIPDFTDAPEFSMVSVSNPFPTAPGSLSERTASQSLFQWHGVSPALDRQAKLNQAAAEEIDYRFDSAIKEAEDATRRGDLEAAENAIQRAQVVSATNRSIFPQDHLHAFDVNIARSQNDLDQARENALRSARATSDTGTTKRIERERRESEGQRRRTVHDLQATARQLTENGQYSNALGVIDQILVLDPTDEYAIGVRPLLEDKFSLQQQRLLPERRNLEITGQLNAPEEKQIPYDDILRFPSDWPEISQTRDQTVASEHSDNIEPRAVQCQLDRPLPELTFDGVGFSDVIGFLRDVSGSNIFVNWKSLERAGVDRNALVTTKLRNIKFSKALSIILDGVGGREKLGYVVEEGVITIATESELGRATAMTRVYDLRDLIRAAPDAPNLTLETGGNSEPAQNRQELVDKIVRMLINGVGAANWRDGGGNFGQIRELSGQIIVSQTPANHRIIQGILESLRGADARQSPGLSSALYSMEQDCEGLLYTPPAFRRDEASVFQDLLQYAPGLNTTDTDVAGLLEFEAEPDPGITLGKIDPAARELIARARGAGWRKVTIPATAEKPAYDIAFDGTGRYAMDRLTETGLRERVVCDGHTLLHLYPELGLGTRRKLSRFYRSFFASLVPFVVPAAEDLAHGADVVMRDPHTVAVVPHRTSSTTRLFNSTTNPTTNPSETLPPTLELQFDESGSLAKRRIITAGRVVSRQVYLSDGSVTTTCEGAANTVQKLAMAASSAPELDPPLAEYVVLPMPFRSRATREGQPTDGSDEHARSLLREDQAIALLGSYVATGDRSIAPFIAGRYFARNDRRLGFYVLMEAVSNDWSGQLNRPPVEMMASKDHPTSPVAHYLVWLRQTDAARPTSPPKAVLAQPLLHRLADFRRIAARWSSQPRPDAEASDVSATQPSSVPGPADFHEALAFARASREMSWKWAIYTMIAGYRGNANDSRELADLAGSFRNLPELAYAAACEQAKQLARAGKNNEAADLLTATYRESLARQIVPPINAELRSILLGHKLATTYPGTTSTRPADNTDWQILLSEAYRMLATSGRRTDATALAWQCWQIGDAETARSLIQRLVSDGTPAEQQRAQLAAVELFTQTGQTVAADETLRRLLEDQRLGEIPELWRLAGTLARQRKLWSRAVTCAERVSELEFAELPDAVDLKAFREQYAKLLADLEHQALAAQTLELPTPSNLADRVIRVTDRWRAIDPEPATPCQTAARILLRVGESERAWDYFTTACSEPAKDNAAASSRWVAAASELRNLRVPMLADRAAAEACASEPDNAQLVWDRALALEQQGDKIAAREEFKKLAYGHWEERFESLQRAAAARLQ